MTIKIKTQTDKREVQIEAKAGATLLQMLQETGIYIDASCGGKGTCGRCKVWVDGEEKLACRTLPGADCTVIVPDTGQENMAVLTGQTEAKASVLRRLDFTKRDKLGVAVDIGTTTIAMALVSVETGKVLVTTTSVNHQRSYGADVISRMQASNEGKGGLLQESIQRDLQCMTEELCQKAGASLSNICKVVIAGNTTMCHLLRGLSCETLGVAPFVPVDISLWKEDYGNVKVTILPGISAFVGADVVAGIYDSGMMERDALTMLLDIGTNGEMVIGNREGILVTSAAAGPVFEGGNISCGMPGVPGAITHLRLKEQDSKEMPTILFETLESQPACGLCGTGIIDMMAELVRIGACDENGNLEEEWFEDGFGITDGISFTQEDIREIQMGKSAIRAGIETLLAECGMPEKVYLAGGFGCSLDERSAIAIGLLPESFAGRIEGIGNGALSGAIRFLTDENGEAAVNRILNGASEINLAMHEKFNDLYMQHMFFE